MPILWTLQGLVSEAIAYAMETSNFDHAFALAKSNMKDKLPEVHLKYALLLEDEGRFKEAEAEFVAARKPREAVDMCVGAAGDRGRGRGLWREWCGLGLGPWFPCGWCSKARWRFLGARRAYACGRVCAPIACHCCADQVPASAGLEQRHAGGGAVRPRLHVRRPRGAGQAGRGGAWLSVQSCCHCEAT